MTITADRLSRDSAAHASYDAQTEWAQREMSEAERAEAKQGARLGRIATAREIAVAMLTRDAELRAMAPNPRDYHSDGGGIHDRIGKDGLPRPFGVQDEPRTLDESRWIVNAAESAPTVTRSVIGRVSDGYRDTHGGWHSLEGVTAIVTRGPQRGRFTSLSDPGRMDTADVSRIASRAAIPAAKLARRLGVPLKIEDREDLHAACMLYVLERGRKDDAEIGTDTRAAMQSARDAQLPRWRAIERADDPADATAAMYAERWSALTFKACAQPYVRARVADAARRGIAPRYSDSDTRSDEQRAADYAATVANDFAGADAMAVEIVGGTVERNGTIIERIPAATFTVTERAEDGTITERANPLTNPERDALRCALLPERIVELAQREGRTANALMVSASRGRVALSHRWRTAGAMRRALRSVSQSDRALRDALRAVTDAMGTGFGVYHKPQHHWPMVERDPNALNAAPTAFPALPPLPPAAIAPAVTERVARRWGWLDSVPMARRTSEAKRAAFLHRADRGLTERVAMRRTLLSVDGADGAQPLPPHPGPMPADAVRSYRAREEWRAAVVASAVPRKRDAVLKTLGNVGA